MGYPTDILSCMYYYVHQLFSCKYTGGQVLAYIAEGPLDEDGVAPDKSFRLTFLG